MLGPVLFLVYINGLLEDIVSEVRLFAERERLQKAKITVTNSRVTLADFRHGRLDGIWSLTPPSAWL